MIDTPRLSRFFQIWFGVLLVALWGSALFEPGLSFFVERMGITVFRLSGILLLISSALLFLGKARLLGYSFFRHHKLLLLLYTCYWLLAWAGTLYSPAAKSGQFAVAEYVWYTILALATILILPYFSIEQRKMLFLLVGLSSLLILGYFSAAILLTGADTVARAKFGISAFRDYNVFSRSLILGVLLLFLGRKDSRSHVSMLKLFSYIGLLAAIVAVTVLSGSRRSITLYGPLAVGAPFFLLLIRSQRRFARAIIGATIVSALLLAVGVNVLSQDVINSTIYSSLDDTALQYAANRMERGVGFLTGERADITSRLWRWEAAWDVMGEFSWPELLVGRGTRSFENESKLQYTYPHNFLLSALLEGGVLKLLVLVAFVVVWMRHVLRACCGSSFWWANFLLVSNGLWLATVTISSAEFFSSKQFLLIFVVYAAFWSGTGKVSPQGPGKTSMETAGEAI